MARRLLQVAGDERDPTNVFVLLDAATEFAVDAGDLPLALEAADLQAAKFAVQLQAKRLDILKEIAKSASNTNAGRVVELLLREADALSSNRDFKAAASLISIAQATARRVKDNAGQQAASARLAALRESEKQAAKSAPLIERLETNPNDREAASLLGKHRCFVEEDWAAGLPLLAGGDDRALAELAVLDASADMDAGTRIKAADAWWKFGDSSSGPAAIAARQQARLHYTMALAGLSGLDKARVEKRPETPESAQNSAARIAGLTFWLDATDPGTCVSESGLTIQ